MLSLTLSNELEKLSEHLVAFFFTDSHPFEKRFLILPGEGTQNYLRRFFAEHPRLQIGAGVQFFSLNQAMKELLPEGKKIPSFLELSLKIEESLYELEGLPLAEYMGSGKQKSRRTAFLADELAHLFQQYGQFALHSADKGWQQKIWDRVFSSWTYPIEIAQTPIAAVKHPGAKIAFFGFSYLPPPILSFFSQFDAHLYQLSPCALYWDDLCSEKEQVLLKKQMRKKGVKEAIQTQMEAYLGDTHPLLGNNGVLLREQSKALDAFAVTIEEEYGEPQGKTALSQLKKDLLYLNPSPLSIDSSIQIHSAPSLLREVEVVRDVLEALIREHPQDPITPKEIVVLAVDIAAYAPYIHMVFGGKDSPFSYQMEGLELGSVSSTAQGVLHFLSLPEKRFSLSSVMQLFSFASFKEKMGFSAEEVREIFHWCHKAEVRWGLESWEQGLRRLLLGLAVLPDEESYAGKIWPAGCIAHSEQELFGRFLDVFAEIKRDFPPFYKALSRARPLG